MLIRNHSGRLILVVAVLAGLASFVMGLHAENASSDRLASDAFETADLEFRSFYAGGRAETLAKLGPVIVVELDRLILIRDGNRIEAPVIPPLYHRLKAISHVPLAIYVSLAPYGRTPLDQARLTRLRAFRASVTALSDSLDNSGFSAEQLDRSRLLLQRCMEFLDGVLKNARYEDAELRLLTKAAGPLVLASAGDAAKSQIDAYQAQVTSWRRDLPAEEWSRLRVLVLGSQMPRKHNVAVQYFAKVLGVPGESRRLVFAEELSGEKQGLNLLATHQLDSELAVAFFGDPNRMEIDLLGNAASVYLDSLDLSR
ncbi:MAG: hypothetical protein JWN86_4591 [Planctomycetota bacterium]|nr:hypothetical protein [Planctomycetota bacterium]